MGQRIFLVDVEATNKTPYSGVMTEFGVVDFNTRCWFHGHLWDFHPDQKVPARPVAEHENPGLNTPRVGRSTGRPHHHNPVNVRASALLSASGLMSRRARDGASLTGRSPVRCRCRSRMVVAVSVRSMSVNGRWRRVMDDLPEALGISTGGVHPRGANE